MTPVPPLFGLLFLVLGTGGFLCGVLGKEFTLEDSDTPIPRTVPATFYIVVSILFIGTGAWSLFEWWFPS